MSVYPITLIIYQTGIKINRLDKLDARGYNRPQIASRAIEAYLIQVPYA